MLKVEKVILWITSSTDLLLVLNIELPGGWERLACRLEGKTGPSSERLLVILLSSTPVVAEKKNCKCRFPPWISMPRQRGWV